MAWTLDTSGLLVSDGNVVTEEGQPKGKLYNFIFGRVKLSRILLFFLNSQ